MGALHQPPLLILIGLLLLRTVLLFVGDTIAYGIARTLDPAATWNQSIVWSNLSIVAIDVVTVIVVALVLRRAGSGLGAILRTTTPGRDIAWGLLMTLIVHLGFLVTTFLGNVIAYQGAPPAPTSTFQPPLWLGLWCLLVMPATIAVAEEVLYRGYLQSVLTARWGRIVGLVVMSAAFGLQHLALTPYDPQAWLARFVTTFGAGIMFGLLAMWMKRLWPLIIAHWLLDVVGLGLPMLFFALNGGA